MGLPAAKDPIAQLCLPPGFRFNPTDEELMVQYLCRKVIGHEFSLQIIADVDLYKFDPWVLPSKAVFGEQEWYFFSPRDRKYPNGSRPNRVAGCGYWKATGTDKVISSQGRKVGIKKSLVFYIGRAPKGTKTNWIMHEFRLFDSPRSTCSSKLDDWVLCRIYQKNSSGAAKSTAVESSAEHSAGGGSSSTSSSTNRLVLENFGSVSLDWGVLAGLTAGLEKGAVGPNQAQGNQVGHVVGDGGGTWERFGNRVMEDEVESRLRTQRINQESPNMMWAHSYSNSGDPFGLRYTAPNPVEAFGFRR